MKDLIRFLKDEEGATAIEYALIVSLVSLAIVVSLRSLGTQLNNTFTTVKNSLAR